MQAQRLNFPLLTDQSDFLRKSFGIKADMLGLLPGRQTFVIDKAGRVVLSFNDQVSEGGGCASGCCGAALTQCLTQRCFRSSTQRSMWMRRSRW
jgi:hypothetical protein